VLLDAELRELTYANPRALQLLRLGGAEVPGGAPGTVRVADEDRAPFAYLRRLVLDRDEPAEPVLARRSWPRPDGTVGRMEIAAHRYVFDGEVGWVVVVRDVTVQHVVEVQLRDALDREVEALRRIREVQALERSLLQAISHAVRTPLTVLLGGIDLLERTPWADTGQAELGVGLVKRGGDRLHGLLSDLLELSRNGAGESMFQVVPLARILMEAVERAEVTPERVVVDTPPLLFVGDADALRRALRHALHNAETHGRGLRRLYVGRGEDRVGADESVAPEVVFEIDDAGPGIGCEDRDRVLEPFVQLDRGRPDPGVGLGLTFIRHVARAHQGELELLESPEGGLRLRLRLPGLLFEVTEPDQQLELVTEERR
jgi:signal transduction histidine kinase